MKKVISGNELMKNMNNAVNLLCDTVKTTLGPKGTNVIIDHSTFSPFITNDGATIASNIESDDPVINTILEITKEASIKTNTDVGDGTTTTLVLLQSIFNEGLKLINDGFNPIILKEELMIALDDIINKLKKISRKPNNNDLLNIATTSSNDNNIGKIISDVFIKVKNIDSINIKENNKNYTEIIYNKGYFFDTSLASMYYFNESNEINIHNPYILIFNTYLDDINMLSDIINDILKSKKELVIIANDFSESFINETISLYLDNIIKIYLFKTPLYGINNLIFLNDISIISNTNIINNLNDLNNIRIGKVLNIKINKDTTYIEFDKSNKIIDKIINNLKKEKIDNDFNKKRISMLNNLSATILVGANTVTEKRELLMRYQDSLCAINTSLKGILLGGGISYLKISDILDSKNDGYKVLKESLKKPFEQILINAGLKIDEIKKHIMSNNCRILYNVKKDEYENIDKTNIIDPLNVLINSITNAVSIASMLLTTNSLVINEYNNSNKINDFNEL